MADARLRPKENGCGWSHRSQNRPLLTELESLTGSKHKTGRNSAAKAWREKQEQWLNEISQADENRWLKNEKTWPDPAHVRSKKTKPTAQIWEEQKKGKKRRQASC
jgi:hypothetical protein